MSDEELQVKIVENTVRQVWDMSQDTNLELWKLRAIIASEFIELTGRSIESFYEFREKYFSEGSGK